MKISTRGRYGVAAMLDLAVHASEGAVSIKSISERQNISGSYLEQIFAELKKAGIVNSVRGPQGGYVPADSPDNITVGMILRALEGSLSPVGCMDEEDPDMCDRYGDCVTRYVWEKVRDVINDVVDGITFESLLEKYKELDSCNGYMYYI